uniref:Bug family tripartite tricarboxylate transporter substrate binding protein n=1 Tax=Sphingomonas bacterium TaxID=1895847 RepID=UPI0020C61E34
MAGGTTGGSGNRGGGEAVSEPAGDGPAMLALKRSAEMAAVFMIGDGALGLLQASRHVGLWRSTVPAVDLLVRSKADGYTLMQAENTTLAFNEHLFPNLPYSPDKDFTYIASIGRFPLALVVHPSFPAKNLAEFIAHVKANPGRVNYASPGNGTAHHMAMELFKQRTNLDLTHVPYKGIAPAMQDLYGGQIQVMML